MSIKPAAWWVPAFSEPVVGRRETKPLLWPEAQPLYDQAALDAAVAAERERMQAVLNLQQASYEREIALEVQAERERCAKLCEDEAARWRGEQDITDFRLCAARIRAASEARSVLNGLELMP